MVRAELDRQEAARVRLDRCVELAHEAAVHEPVMDLLGGDEVGVREERVHRRVRVRDQVVHRHALALVVEAVAAARECTQTVIGVRGTAGCRCKPLGSSRLHVLRNEEVRVLQYLHY